MWWAGTEAFDVYLGTRAVAVCRGAEVLLSSATSDLEASLAALDAWCTSAPPRSTLRVWLSGGLCRPFLVPPIPGVKSQEERWRVAESMAEERTGLAGDLEMWLDEGRPEQSTVAVVLNRDLLTRLQGVLGAHPTQRLRLASLRPWWVDVLRVHADAQAIAARDCDSLTVLVGGGKEFALATTATPILDDEAGRAALSRLLLSSEVEVRSVLEFGLRAGQRTAVGSTDSVALAPLMERIA